MLRLVLDEGNYGEVASVDQVVQFMLRLEPVDGNHGEMVLGYNLASAGLSGAIYVVAGTS